MLDFQDMFAELLELESPMDKYEWIMDYGDAGIGITDAEQIYSNLVQGCTSNLWLVKRDGKFFCHADSSIVNGFASIICDWYNQASDEQKLDFSLVTMMAVGLAPLISMGRQNGIANLIAKIKSL